MIFFLSMCHYCHCIVIFYSYIYGPIVYQSRIFPPSIDVFIILLTIYVYMFHFIFRAVWVFKIFIRQRASWTSVEVPVSRYIVDRSTDH